MSKLASTLRPLLLIPILFFATELTCPDFLGAGLGIMLVSGAEVVNLGSKTHSENLFVVNKELAPDGFQRSTVLVGSSAYDGVFPGPLITGTKGDRFKLNVTDLLTDSTMARSTSIHWHGLFQKTTNYADGVSFVSQCPIVANHSFMYDFQVPDQAGTYWYHSHLSVQYCDGLRGPIVIYDPLDPHRLLYDVDDESTVITISDWYHDTSYELIAKRAALAADATLINGKGRYAGGPNVPLEVINVEYGKRYRFRLISMSCGVDHGFSIDGHNLTIIEVDGVNTQPLTVNYIQLYAAQRYSVVLHANQKPDVYRVRALPTSGVGATNFTNSVNSGILRYNTAPGPADREPTTSQQTDIVALDENDLRPLELPGAPGKPYPGGADLVLNLTMGFGVAPGASAPAFFMNNVTYVSPKVPVLLQILSGKQSAQDLLPSGSVYTLPRNKIIEINLFGGDAIGGPHPFHLHGHAFDVVKTSSSSNYNFVNPVRRDVTLVNQNGQTTIRFVTDNPGPWFLHCHIDPHLEAGLAVVLAEDTRDTKAVDPVPNGWQNLCPIYDSLTSDQLP
ncbi:laccase [Lentinula aff. detonsa]|uniref:Laccase n=1 Tax=Lentinula aff. detonsa TaxID=2804958 RepID=A0AA38NK93_9AGAR|nr:laccase [Lentinula aff. detonsa]